MARIGKYLLISLSLLVIVGAALVGFLFHTPPGRALILSTLEEIVAGELGGELEIDTLEGAPPRIVILRDILFTENGRPWLSIERAELKWRPLAMLSGRFSADLVEIYGAYLYELPPIPPDEEDRIKLELPEDLPFVDINELRIENLQSGLASAPARLDGAGAIHTRDNRVVSSLTLTSSTGHDNIDARINIDPQSDYIRVDVLLASSPQGTLAALARLEDGIFIEASSNTPVDDAVIDIHADMGGMGDVSGVLFGDLRVAQDLSAELTFNPGDELAEIDALGADVKIKAKVEKQKNGGALTLEADAAAGRIETAAQWVNDDIALKAASINATAALNPDFASSLQALLGREITFQTDLRRQRDDYALSIALSGADFSANLDNALSNLSSTLTGDASIRFAAIEGADDFRKHEIVAQTSIELDTATAAKLTGIVVTADQQSSIDGDLAYSFTDEIFDFDGVFDVSPEIAQEWISFVQLDKAAAGAIQVKGAPSQFSLALQSKLPPATIADRKIQPTTLAAAFSGLPSLPTGDLTVTTPIGESGLNLSLRSSPNGRIEAPSVDYFSPVFKFSAQGAFDPEQERVDLEASYEGDRGAEPWPGFELTGAFEAKGGVARKNSLSDLTLSAASLTLNQYTLRGLEASAKGPPGAVNIRLDGREVLLSETRALRRLAANATADLSDDITITLRQLSSVLDTIETDLTAPATITFSEGVSVDNFRLRWGELGSIALDGAFASDHWRADVSLDKFNIPDTDGQLDFQLSLDTSQDRIATGDFELRSLLTQSEAPPIAGSYIWDGSTVSLKSAPGQETISLDVNVPLTLKRSPALSITAEGALSGSAAYRGDISAVAAYLPPSLQSLEGALTANIRLDGSIDAPLVEGNAALTDGAYTEQQTGMSFTGVHTEATATITNENSKVVFTGGAHGSNQQGPDTMTLSGALELGDISAIDLAFELDNAAFAASPVESAIVSGKIDVSGDLSDVKTNGELTIVELNAAIEPPAVTSLAPIEIIDSVDQTDETQSTAPAAASNFDYQFSINANDRIFIRGRGLESEWRADVEVLSERTGPLVIGAMNLRRGWIDFSGRRFELTNGSISFDRLSANNPLLDIRAELQTNDGVTAIIAVSGRADKPSIELLSTPTLPSEDVMAIVLFGKPAQELSAIESLQAAEALAALGGVGPFGGGGITGSLRKAVGLDLLNIDVDPEQGGGSLTIGKYVADGLFVSATQDALGESGSVRVEYEITDSITVETEIEQDGEQTVSANWKRDF